MPEDTITQLGDTPQTPSGLPPLPPKPQPVPEPIPVEKKKFSIKLVLIIVISLILLVGVFFVVNKVKPKATGVAPTVMQHIQKGEAEKYKVDTDGDGFPDFLETIFGYSTTENRYDECYGNYTCADANIQTSEFKKNVVIVLDASGSMDLQLNNSTRMTEAKSAIEKYVQNNENSTNYGLIIYGNKGSNSEADKAVSCASADVISKIGEFNGSNAASTLNAVTPTGWTNMGVAINKAIAELEYTEGKKEIILVSDGMETCDSNPQGAAAHAYKVMGITVNIIGFAVNEETAAQLKSIANEGNGSYATVNSMEEFIHKMDEYYENAGNVNEIVTCRNTYYEEAYKCYQEEYKKVFEWALAEKGKLYKEEITQAEYDAISELEKSASTEKNRIINEKSAEQTEGNKKVYDELHSTLD